MSEHKKKVLYLGLNPASYPDECVHFPILQMVPRSFEEKEIKEAFRAHERWTHLLFTSQVAVSLFFEMAHKASISLEWMRALSFLSVGQKTTLKINQLINPTVCLTAQEETGEGVIELLKALDLQKSFVFFPHSEKSRPLISDFLQNRNISHHSLILYKPVLREAGEKPNLALFDEIVFTSPSTVDAYIELFGTLPQDKILTSIGPITQKHLDKMSHFS